MKETVWKDMLRSHFFHKIPLDGSQGTRLTLSLAQPSMCPGLLLPCLLLSLHSVDCPLVGAVCELGEAGNPGNPSYVFVNGG